jgi:hypothetical protein
MVMTRWPRRLSSTASSTSTSSAPPGSSDSIIWAMHRGRPDSIGAGRSDSPGREPSVIEFLSLTAELMGSVSGTRPISSPLPADSNEMVPRLNWRFAQAGIELGTGAELDADRGFRARPCARRADGA